MGRWQAGIVESTISRSRSDGLWQSKMHYERSDRGMHGDQEICSKYRRDDDTEIMSPGEVGCNVWAANKCDGE